MSDMIDVGAEAGARKATNRLVNHVLDLFRKGGPQEAIRLLEDALVEHPCDLDILRWLGRLHYADGNAPYARARYEAIISQDPQDSDALAALAQLALDRTDTSLAIELYRKVLSISPSFPGARYNLGLALESLWRLDEAAQVLGEQCKQDPSNADAFNALGNVLRKLGRFEESLSAYTTALRMLPQSHEILNNLGLFFYERGNLIAAVDSFRRALEIDAERPLTHMNLAFALLAMERFAEGWREYEWRLRLFPLSVSIPAEKAVSNLAVLQKGESVLVCAEQGLGDTIQFVRFVPALQETGVHVHLMCQPALEELLRNSLWCDQIIPYHGATPGHGHIIPLLSLPGLLGIDRGRTVAAMPYLFPDTDLVQQWRNRLPSHNGMPLIGIAWAGSRTGALDRVRSVPEKCIRELLSIPGFCFVNLQKDRVLPVSEEQTASGCWFDAAPYLNSLNDTAALISVLDLVISADTAIAHLAGGLNKRVWTMLPFATDWRWMGRGTTSPWYPSMTLFRQSEPWDWESVINTIAPALHQLRAQ